MSRRGKVLKDTQFYLFRDYLGYHHVLYLPLCSSKSPPLKITTCQVWHPCSERLVDLGHFSTLHSTLMALRLLPGKKCHRALVSHAKKSNATSGVCGSGNGSKSALQSRFTSHTGRSKCEDLLFTLKCICSFCSWWGGIWTIRRLIPLNATQSSVGGPNTRGSANSLNC